MSETRASKRALIAELEAANLDETALDAVAALVRAASAEISADDETWTIRDEANALTVAAFRNGFLEDLHAGKYSDLLADSSLSRITDREMRKLMIESSAQLARLLLLKETDPQSYSQTMRWLRDAYCQKWERTATKAEIDQAA
ncbi:MAG TPA: hypothetical protein VGJ81_05425 [Thermoanaerobaculia bacterium]|jgi:hypothetical protein